MTALSFDVFGHGPRTIEITHVFNGGYAGRDTEQVQHHIDELAELGIPGPSRIPTLYPLANTLASQADSIQVPHERTSGEAEWALILDGDDVLITVACDHTDRALEVHGVAWSKQSAPDLLGRNAWLLTDIQDDFDHFTLRAWVTKDGADVLIQDGSPAQLLPPSYWLEKLREADLAGQGVMVMSGTIPMIAGVDQFADGWSVELTAPDGSSARVAYSVEQLAAAWE